MRRYLGRLADVALGFAVPFAFAVCVIIGAKMLPPAHAQVPGPNNYGAGVYGPPFTSQGSHWISGGGLPPTLNAACGTSPVGPLGTDSAFKFQSGTTTSATCTATFAVPWTSPPTCIVSGETNLTSWKLNSGASITISGVLDNSVYHVHCIGRAGG